MDLSDSPASLQVKNSGHHKIDGEYHRLPEPSRGRPAYSMEKDGKKPVYLFWYKTSKWYFSFELGASKNLARIEDSGVEGRRQPPCEPHPFVWKVMAQSESKDAKDSKHKSYVVTPPMRVIDCATLDPKAEAVLRSEPLSASRHSEKTAGRTRSRKKEPKADDHKDKQEAAKEGKRKEKEEARAGKDKKEKEAQAKADDDKSSDEDSESDSENEEASKKNESDSDSDSKSENSGSSSSDDAASQKSEKKAEKGAKAGAEKGPVLSGSDKEQKREEFIAKLRLQLVGIKDPKQRSQKLQQVRAMLNERSNHLLNVAGMTQSDVKALMDSLDRDFAPRAKPKQPPAPPPKHLMERKDGTSSGAGAPESNGNRSGVKRSALRKAGISQKPKMQRRISWEQASARFVQVESFRNMGEQLWFQMPGAYVACDSCEKQVPQSMGALQGEPERPQFAQFQFLCHECMQLAASAPTLPPLNGGY